MTRPTDCTTSTTELRGLRNITASRAGTSTPSDRQRAFERMRHSLVRQWGFEPVELGVALECVVGAVDVVDLDAQRRCCRRGRVSCVARR